MRAQHLRARGVRARPPRARRGRGYRALAATAAAAAALVPAACGTPQESRPVQIVGVWTGAEQTAFEKNVLDHSGVRYVYTGSRNLDQLLQADVRNGTPPDIAVVASPTDLAAYYSTGELQPVTGLSQADYGGAWRQLVEARGQQYAIVLKADLKSIVWYDPRTVPAALRPSGTGPVHPTWAQLAKLTRSATPWCMGLGADSGSGFPGTDWIAAIMLRSAGPEAYTNWIHGSLAWNSAPVRKAFTTWGTILHGVNGGSASALLTRFDTAGQPMFTSSPGCRLDSEGSFITGSYLKAKPLLRPGEDFDFFALPDITPQSTPSYEVAANFAGMFRNTPEAQKLMRFLAGEKGQVLWSQGGSFSVNRRVPLTTYRGVVNQSVAKILTQQQQPGAQLCFGASDLMGAKLRAAFYQAVLSYAAAPSDGRNLDRLLQQLDQAQATQTSAQKQAAKQTAVCGK